MWCLKKTKQTCASSAIMLQYTQSHMMNTITLIRKSVIYSLLAACLVLNSRQTFQTLTTKKRHDILPAQVKYAGISEFIKGQRRIGYLTEQSLDNIAAAFEFAQAQYALAPVILDFNNPNLEFVIISTASTQAALEMIRTARLEPVATNKLQVLLTKNPAKAR